MKLIISNTDQEADCVVPSQLVREGGVWIERHVHWAARTESLQPPTDRCVLVLQSFE